ncbi:Uncharacterised protein [Bordetella pertussis]|nr:Uncharacterised protein [Bordetella pertussis]
MPAAVSRNMLRSSQLTSTRTGVSGAACGTRALARAVREALRARTKNPAPCRDCTSPRATSRS